MLKLKDIDKQASWKKMYHIFNSLINSSQMKCYCHGIRKERNRRREKLIRISYLCCQGL